MAGRPISPEMTMLQDRGPWRSPDSGIIIPDDARASPATAMPDPACSSPPLRLSLSPIHCRAFTFCDEGTKRGLAGE
jgi:hypothetical protein